MAVSSIRIADASSGNRMQVVEAVELDGSGFSTVMERVLVGTDKISTVLGTATRGSTAPIAASETFDLTALPADLTSNLITVGDKSLLVVICEMTQVAGTVTVTPILFDSQATPVALSVLDSKTFTPTYAFRRGSASGNYVVPVRVWDTVGAYKIGLHVSALSSSNQCKLWGKLI